jgi:serine/threonine protein kinase
MGCSSSSLSAPTLSDFQFHDFIGEGGFAQIYRAIHKPTNSCYAMKIIDIQACCHRKGGSEMLRSELESLITLKPHPFIAKLHFAFQNYVSCYLLFELLEGGDLRYFINTQSHFNESKVAYFAGCIGSALRHIHSCGVLHRDIKPENIIFDLKGFPKLIDFGIAYVCPDKTKMICTNCSGTRLYSAPELFTPSHAHGPAADFWALGLVLYEMLFLSHPFRNHCPRDFMKFATKYSQLSQNMKPSITHQYSNTAISTQQNKEGILTEEKLNAGDVLLDQNPSICYQSPNLEISQRKTPHGDHLPEFDRAPKPNTLDGVIDSSEFDEFDALVLPSHLRVPLPQTTAFGEPISMSCSEFFDELFDIRYDRRFGATAERYGDFVKHPWLTQNAIHLLGTSPHETGQLPNANSKPIQETSPLNLNHDAFKFYLLKRQAASYSKNVDSRVQIPQSLDSKKTCFGFKSLFASHLIFPHDYPSNVLDILETYEYSAFRQ